MSGLPCGCDREAKWICESHRGTRTFWLSFSGETFLGVAIVDVTHEDALASVDEMLAKFPNAAPFAEWMTAAIVKTHRLGINPGGEVLFIDITDAPPPEGVTIVKDKLLSKEDLIAQGHQLERPI